MSMTEGTEIIELEKGVYARLHDGLTNAGIIIGDDSVMVIDSLRVPSFARDLISDIKYISDKPIKFVIDTHAHWDHSWGNEEFPEATIIGHQNCYKEMIDLEWNKQWREKVVNSGDSWSEEAKLVKITPPDQTFEKTMRLYFGGREIILRYLGKAHTSGDIFIHLPDSNILFTGDVAQNEGMPFFGDSYPDEWPSTDDKLIDFSVDKFVAGHGPIGDYDDLVNARNFLHKFIKEIKDCINENQNEYDTTIKVVNLLEPEFGHWRGFDRLDTAVPDVFKKLIKEV